MEKSMYVTIEEFLQNGGQLETGREIYIISVYPHRAPILTGYYLFFDKKQKVHLVENDHFKSKPVLDIVGYVKIEVKPIYK